MTTPTPLEPLIAITPPAIGCAATGCPGTVAVQWRRRLTDAELADALALEQHRRETAAAEADPSGPPPDFGPMPTSADYTRAVYACGRHALSLDLAAHVHAATCTAPGAALPGCDCTPEPLPGEQPPTTPDTVTLPTGWVVPAP
ncbi:hypothetical protein [Kitasatospora cineracea]|uniref:hypothetical protein n=1 Tax=Kitasatospora cineracea TaxID=88074 RepID=UPI003795B2F3